MIDRKHAGNEIGRLIGLDFFRADQRAVRELVTALTFARNDVIATAVINEWLEGQQQRPTPADLRRMVAAHNEASEQREKAEEAFTVIHYDCRTCGGIGYYGGQHADLWRWCTCSAARLSREKNPELVEEANAVRDELLKRFPEKPELAAMTGGVDGDGYQGEF